VEKKAMVDRKTIEMDLIKLAGGGRLLRLAEPQSGCHFSSCAVEPASRNLRPSL